MSTHQSSQPSTNYRDDPNALSTNGGIDIEGPFPKSRGQVKYIVVDVDYATKWIVAKSITKIREKEMVEFSWNLWYSASGFLESLSETMVRNF